jgi:hypothetical protein
MKARIPIKSTGAGFPKGMQSLTQLEALLLEGLKGKGVRVTPKWWDEFRAGIIKRHTNKGKK